MKVALAQCNYTVGDFEQNTRLILDAIREAKAAGADLVVFAELSVCGYPPRDFLEFDDFILKCRQSVEQIAGFCDGIAAIVGAPSVNPAVKGKNLYNSAWFLAEGAVQTLVHKTLLPNYDVFDEYRYFEPNREPFRVVDFKGHRLAITICEDLWNLGEDPMYLQDPMEELIKLRPDFILNIAASPFHRFQPEIRSRVMADNARKYGLPLVYVNQVGGQTELLFDGGSMVVAADGRILHQLPRFQEGLMVSDLSGPAGNISPQKMESSMISDIHDALVMGIRDYFRKMGFSRAILGLSGGIDSAVTMVLAAEALGNENIMGLLLPSAFSSQHSIDDAETLAKQLNSPYNIIPITDAYASVASTLEPLFSGFPFNITEENMQARIRAVILMAMANKFGYVLLNTSNKSEAAVGYGTIYGDMCGGISVLGDLYKTEVYELAQFINREREIIPVNTLLKPPSAELRPGQKDSDSLPPYELLDKLLYAYIEEKNGPDELVQMGFERKLVDRILKLVNTNEWKRYQTPPILRVSSKAFGMGRRMPIVAHYLG